MDRDKLEKEIEEMARNLRVKLFDVITTLPDGTTWKIKVVPHAYRYILNKHQEDHPGATYQIPEELTKSV